MFLLYLITWILCCAPPITGVDGFSLSKPTNVTNHPSAERNTLDPSNCTSDLALGNTTEVPNNTSFGTETAEDWLIDFYRFEFVARGIYFPVVTICGIIGNVLTLLVLRQNVLQPSCVVYLRGLAVANIVSLIIYSPTFSRGYPALRALRTYQTFNTFFISYVFPLHSMSHTAAIWTIICYSFERLFAIAYPLKAIKLCSQKRATISVICVYLFAIVLNFVRFLRYRPILRTDPATGEIHYIIGFTEVGAGIALQTFLYWSYVIFTDIIPFPTLVCLNTAVIWKVWRARNNRLQLKASTEGSLDDEQTSREMQVTRVMIAIVTTFLLCNFASAWTSVYAAVHGQEVFLVNPPKFLYYLTAIGSTMFNTNPLANCILYFISSEAMRLGYKSLLCRQTCAPISFFSGATKQGRLSK